MSIRLILCSISSLPEMLMELSANIPLIDLDLDFRIIVNLGVECNEYLEIEIKQVNGIKFLKVRDEDNRLIASSLKMETLTIDANPDLIYLENNDLAQLLIEREILALVKRFDVGIECQLIILSDFDELAEI